MSEKDLKKFAGTKLKGLPTKLNPELVLLFVLVVAMLTEFAG